MGVIKIESFDFDTSGTTGFLGLNNDIGTVEQGFIRKLSSTDKATGLIGNTGNLGPVNAHCGIFLDDPETVSYSQGNASPQKIVGEAWRYTGTPGGADEFISRGSYTIVLSGATASATVTGLVNRNNAVPIVNGMNTTNASTSDWDASTVACFINSSGEVVVSRQSITGTLTVYVTVVEFTGSNWRVGHAISTNHDSAIQTVLMNTDSTGSGGATFDVGSWSNALILDASMQGDTAETGLADNLLLVAPNGTTSMDFSVIQGDAGARNDGDAYAHVVVNTGMVVTRSQNTNYAEGNNTYTTQGFPAGTSTTESIDELGLEWFVTTSGTGAAHARGRLTARITSTAGTVQHWVHRSGNNVRTHLGIVNLSGVTGVVKPVISGGPAQFSPGGTGLVLTGSNFLPTQGLGKVELWSDATGTIKVEQTVVSWSDSSITFDSVQGSISDGTRFLVVTDNLGVESNPFSFTFGLPVYNDVIAALSPDHWWRLDNDGFADQVGARPITNVVVGDGGSFEAVSITDGNTHSWLVDNGAERECADSSLINLAAIEARTMGGWIQVNGTATGLSCIYKEGGSVNNILFMLGMGNVLIAQLGDTGDDNVQVYSDFKLEPGRPYHIMFRFDYNATPKEFTMFIDGVEQGSSFGNPLLALHLDSHSGDIIWGGLDTSVEVFGTDVTFVNQESTYYSQWYSWTRALDKVTELDAVAFKRGAPPFLTIAKDTTANMLAEIATIYNTVRGSYPLAIRIPDPTDSSNLAIDADNIVFDEKSTIFVEWRGGGELTWKNLNGSNLTLEKTFISNGGTVTIINPATLTLTGIENPSEVRIYEAGTETELAGQEDVISGTFSASIEAPSVDISVHALGFLNIRLKNIGIAGDASIPIQQRVDRQYEDV